MCRTMFGPSTCGTAWRFASSTNLQGMVRCDARLCLIRRAPAAGFNAGDSLMTAHNFWFRAFSMALMTCGLSGLTSLANVAAILPLRSNRYL